MNDSRLTTAIRLAPPKLATGLAAAMLALAAGAALAAPPGYVKQTLALDAPPAALAFDADGRLYALEQAGFGSNTATMRVFAADGAPAVSFPVVGDDELNLFVGGMAYDPVGDRLLVTDNTADGRLYAVGKTGGQQTIAANIATIAGVAVRRSGEIVVSTAPGFGAGGVYEIDRTTGARTLKLAGLDFGAGLAFDAADDLVVQDAASTAPFLGRLQRVPTTSGPAGLAFGAVDEILSGMSAGYGVAVDGAGRLFVSGRGGVFRVAGAPPTATLFDANGSPAQFAAAIAFRAGAAPFEPFTGPAGGVLAVAADAGFVDQDLFVTLIAPALPEDFHSDGVVDGGDLSILVSHFGDAAALRQQGDANGDQQIDGGDLLQWQRAVGASTLLALGPPAGALPEPGLAASFPAAALWIHASQRRRRERTGAPRRSAARRYVPFPHQGESS